MLTKDLRCGNWVNLDGTDNWYTIIDPTKFSEFERLKDHIHPVQLTPEVMLHFGFTHGNGNKFHHPALGKLCFLYETEGFDKFHLYYETDKLFIGKPVQHLHQLQNLFYILVGEELDQVVFKVR